MKSNVMPSLVQIPEENLKQFFTEVKETIATGINHLPANKKQKSFGIVDLWSCRNKMKTASSLRRH